MHQKNEELLRETYPNLYSDLDYFAIGDGWFEIIDELSKKLEPLGVKAVQVKEKFGSLRFYVHDVPDVMFDDVYHEIYHAESKSYLTCEYCGDVGKMRRGGWVKTLCNSCHEGANNSEPSSSQGETKASEAGGGISEE